MDLDVLIGERKMSKKELTSEEIKEWCTKRGLDDLETHDFVVNKIEKLNKKTL